MATTRNVPLSIDDQLLAEIDRVAEMTNDTRSAVMRRAIREGLPLVQNGGGADAVTLDSETSRDVNTACKEAEVSRAKFIIESIRTGLQATYYRLMRDKWTRAQEKNPKDAEAEKWIHSLENSMMNEDPMGREVRAALRQRGAAVTRFHDILQHTPEAWHRYKLMEQLTEVRRKPGGLGASVWGSGISTDEVKWQLEMAEKYGSTAIPSHEIKSREKARKNEDRTHFNTVQQELSASPSSR